MSGSCNLFYMHNSKAFGRARIAPRGRQVLKVSGVKGLFVVALLAFQTLAMAQEACRETAGKFASIEGQVQVRGNDRQNWQPARPAEPLCKGDTIRVGELSRAAVVLINEAVIRLDQNTTMRLIDISGKKEERSLIELAKGAIKSFIRRPRQLSVNTPYLNGSVEGTEFQVRVEEDSASILLLEGRVLASNSQGSATVSPGEIAEARAGAAPTTRLLVRPRDAVQWALYYPPIQASAGQGDPTAQLETLNQVAAGNRDAAYHLQRASLLLGVGRQDEAQVDIDAALARDPRAGLGHALRAIIHVVRNERPQALAEADKGVALSDSAATRIALSYAQQADFRLEAARDTLLAAVRNHPDDALAWARLSELWLMLGNKDESHAAAAKAVALAPKLARTQLVLGFAALAEYRDADARARFERAIELSPSDPLAHLGLGLARISAGQLEAGRSELEVAVALDASQSLLRAYLGKAYFEEKRGPLDAQQFALAKQLDPLDPTAYLYDGIRKQTENRPVEALADMEQAIALNDNRAVYRSRLLLDKDEAARGTSLARVYNDLGFTEPGVAAATRSLSIDPANASAHRFLADVYQGTRRREVARVSELTQAQMLQDLNLNPIQLSTSEANLNIVTAGGPASAGFNEFTPLFQRNQTQLSLAGLAGNKDTTSFEGALSGVYDRFSFSLGALAYDTDGWRPNNALEQDLYNVFVQAALTDKLNVQAEFRHRKSTEGDLAFNFDPDDYLADKTVKREQDTTRLGLRYSASPQTHFLLSYIHSDRDETLHQFEDNAPVTIATDARVEDKSDQIEAQLIHQFELGNLIAGLAYSDTDRTEAGDVLVTVFGTPVCCPSVAGEGKIRQPRAYAYLNYKPMATLTWTLGATYEEYKDATKDGTLKSNGFTPKLGMQWDLTEQIRVRAAALRAVKPALVNNRTLEPTQVAGFNQLFDDINGTVSDLYAGGFDWRAHKRLSAGGAFTWRTLDEPLYDAFNVAWLFEERKEQLHKLYLNWTPTERLAIRTELVYDRYTSESGIATADDNLPEKAVTWSLPIGVSYFDPSGFFAGLSATYVDQSIRRSVTAIQASGDDRFVVVDASIGYRLPKRRGIISFAVKNLFDTDFKYQDDSYREFRDEPSIGPYFPERTFMGRIALSF